MPLTYLDHNATTPIDERVLAVMLPFLREHYGNASSRHELGTRSRQAIAQARAQVAELVGAHPSQVIFTSGGTEANNLVIKGVAASLAPSQIVIGATEHLCVMHPAQALARNGWQCRQLPVSSAGLISAQALTDAMREPTAMLSVMLANNETGVIQDVAQLAHLAREQGAIVHTDAVQALGKIAVDFAALEVHAMTLSGHKINGPKGIGALVVDKRLDLQAQLAGGGQERGFRGGTENVAAIVGFGAACELAKARFAAAHTHAITLRQHLETGLIALGAYIFGADATRLPNTVYFALPRIHGEALVIALDNLGFALSSGAACSSNHSGISTTLMAMGVAPELAHGAVRCSLGITNTAIEVDALLQAIRTTVERMQLMKAVAA